MTAHHRIATAAEQLCRKHVIPEKVHLTRADAAQLQYEMINQGGKVAHAVMQHGIGKALPRILGLQIVWRSRSFEVL